MPDTTINVFSVAPFNINNGSADLAINVQKTNVTSNNNLFNNEIKNNSNSFNVQTNLISNQVAVDKRSLVVDNKFFRYEISVNKPIEYLPIDENVQVKTFLMRARKISDNSFIYWRSSGVDPVGANSGFNANQINDICVVAYN